MNDSITKDNVVPAAAPRTKAEKLAAVRQKDRDGIALTADEQLMLDTERTRVAGAVAKGRKIADQSDSSKRYNNTDELSTKVAKQLLSDVWNVSNPRALDVIVELAEAAAQHFKFKENTHLYRHGLRATIEANRIKGPVDRPEIEDGEVAGELLSRHELWLIWNFSFWRQSEVTFTDWLAIRSKCKSDVFYLGKEVLGKDFQIKPHLAWANFFPSFTPIERGYDQESMKRWLGQQGQGLTETGAPQYKEFLLLASRNAYKSSFSLVWALAAVLNCPDIRLLLISETKNLSKGFIRGFRSYWEVTNKNNPMLFQQLFPEYMIPVGDGSTLSFESPMARLSLIQSTAESTSMDSSVAGNRADVLLADDPISNITVGNEEQRNASIQKFALLRKLGEVGSITTCLGTPWHSEDLYADLIRRRDEDPESSWAVRIDPAWKVKPEARHKQLKDLVEEDVDLLFPSRLTFRFLTKERKSADERFFRSQNLVEFLDDEENLLKCQFTEDEIRRHTRPLDFFRSLPFVASGLFCDVAFSVSRYADFSCLVFATVRKFDNRNILVVEDVRMERWKTQELAGHIVDMCSRHNPQRVVSEKVGAYESLNDAIRKNAFLKSVAMPFISFLATTGGSQTLSSKAARIKALEPLLAQDVLYFASAHWNDQAFGQLVKFDGITKSGASRKDDFPDALARSAMLLPRTMYEEEKQVVDRQAQETAERDELRRQQYDRMFSTRYELPKPVDEPQQAPSRYSGYDAILPPGMRKFR